MIEHLVPLPPQGTVIALQFWHGDMTAALRLARLLSDIESTPRDDITLAFCRRFDCPWSDEAERTFFHCAEKFGVMKVRSEREGVGHPDGSWGLWAGVMDQLSAAWQAGGLRAHSVFTIEADGCPLRPDWIDRLRVAHDQTLRAGKRVTGCLMDRGVFPHCNGSLMAHLSLWPDRPSLHRTPPGAAWDLFHAAVLTSEARPTGWIKNIYSAGNYSAESLEGLSRETAWVSSNKDLSIVEWAERTLAARAPAADPETDQWERRATPDATGWRDDCGEFPHRCHGKCRTHSPNPPPRAAA